MALQTANQYRLVADASPLAAAVSEMMTDRRASQEKQALAKQEMLRQNLKTTGAQLFHIRHNIKGKDKQKAAIANLATEAINNGQDPSVYEELLGIDDADLLNTHLMQKVIRAESHLKEGESLTGKSGAKVLKPEEILVSETTGETIAEGGEKPPAFQTDPGKVIADTELINDMFGADSPQAKAFAELLEAEAAGEPPSISDVSGMRKEFTKQSGDFIQMRDAYNKIASASDTGAGDVSLIFGFMKIIDPGSTVREGEFATAEQTQGIPDQVVNLYNKAINGERLGETARKNFKAEARNLFEAQLGTQKQLEGVFRSLATRQQANPDDVAIDFVGDLRNLQPVEIAPQKAIADLTDEDLDNMTLEELEALQSGN